MQKFEKIQETARTLGGFSAVIFIASIYFSTSLSIVFSVVVGLAWLIAGEYRHLPVILRQYPVAAWALLLFLCLIVGTTYSKAPTADMFSMLSKYRELFFIPVLIPLLGKGRYRDLAWKTFVLASVLTLLGSYLMDMGILSERKYGVSYKSRITHSVFIAFFAFYCLHKMYDGVRLNGLYVVLFGICMGNLFFVVSGRTGQFTAVALILLFAFQRFNNKGRLLAITALLAASALFLNFSDKSERIYQGVNETQTYIKSDTKKANSDMGMRYTFWKYSMQLVVKRPWLGFGTGSFTSEYQRVAPKKRIKVRNPHNEFLLITVQLGIVGLCVYLGFLYSQYYCAKKLPDTDRWLAHGLLLNLVFTSLFNSPFLDHTEGHWFATMIALCFSSLQYKAMAGEETGNLAQQPKPLGVMGENTGAFIHDE